MSWSNGSKPVLRNNIHENSLEPLKERTAAIPEAHHHPSSPSSFQGKSGNDGHKSDSVLPSSDAAFSKTKVVVHWYAHSQSSSAKTLLSAGTSLCSHWKQRHNSHRILFSVFTGTQCARNYVNRDEGTVPSLMKSTSQTQQGQEMITWLWFPLALFS